MLENIKAKIVELLLKKYILGYVVKFWDATKGYKTQICMVAWGIIFFLKSAGYLEPALADTVLANIEVAGGFSFLQKISRWSKAVEIIKNPQA